MGRNGEESVEKKCTSNLDTGLIRGIILMIIPLSSPLDFVLVARNPDPNYWCIFSNGL